MGLELKYVVCKRCGMVTMAPRFSEEALQSFYQETYRTLYEGSEVPTEHLLREQAARALHLATTVKHCGYRPARVLDIGCSSGELLCALRDLGADELVGVEPGDAHRRFAEERGISVRRSWQELVADGCEPFDLVTLSHVLEHMVDPLQALATIRGSLIREHGVLLVEVPNLYGHTCYEIAHLHCFTRRTLCHALRASGFQIVKMRIHGIPRRYEGSGRYLTACAVADRPRRQVSLVPVIPLLMRLLRRLGLPGYLYGSLPERLKRRLLRRRRAGMHK